MASYPEGRSACVLCGHDVALHNYNVGCPACSCAATPGEANYNAHAKKPYEGPILRTNQTISHYETRVPYGAPRAYREAAEEIRASRVPAVGDRVVDVRVVTRVGPDGEIASTDRTQPREYLLVGVDIPKIRERVVEAKREADEASKADLARKAVQIADTVAGGGSIAGFSGIQANTRKIAHGAALRAARIALGLPATEPYVWDAEAAREKVSQEIEYGPDEHGDA
jgi:hypothetical protein